ncbi:MAG: phosphoadenosine phosphosulfate reductase [Minicystis sp.]
MLVGLHQRGIRPDLVLFADTGGEKPETYAYEAVMQRWLASVGFPPVTTVKLGTVNGKLGTYSTLEENCLVNHTLPSLAFGYKSCSLKWKVAPMDRFVEGWPPAIEAWTAGRKVTRAIGYDAGPKDAKRAWNIAEDDRYEYVYPLREWGWGRDRCAAEIEAAELPVPPKSACFFCPATKPDELAVLIDQHPELADRIVALEATAKPYLKTIDGLWRKPVTGLRGGTPRPGSMTEFIVEQRKRPSLAA